MKYRDTASFGKRQEYLVIAELLRRGYDVYQTLVDDQQIDCIVRLPSNNGPKYVDVQIKARSSSAKKESWGEWPSVKLENSRQNLVFIFYSEPLGKTWIVPSLEIANKGYRSPSGANKPIYKIAFAKAHKRGGKVVSHKCVPEFEKYLDAYFIIRQVVGEKFKDE